MNLALQKTDSTPNLQLEHCFEHYLRIFAVFYIKFP